MTKAASGEGIRGIFSQKKMAKIGAGTTARKTEIVTYFRVQELEDGSVEIQMLNADGSNFGAPKKTTRDDLLTNYTHETEKSLTMNAPPPTAQDMEIQKAVARGDKFRKRGETFSAEYEYGKALQLDERNVRANFGIGLCYIDRGEREKAHEVFERLVKLDAAFAGEHKHLFNEFGIALRKSGMHGEAMGYYQRALDLSPEDENLLYNMARAALEMGAPREAAKHLAACLRLNPSHAEATQFVEYLKRKKLAGG